jgi:transcriptional regulator with XRE-family HTH domain
LGYVTFIDKNQFMAVRSKHQIMQITPEEVLKNLRTARGTKQTDLAAQLSKPQSFVSKYESLERRLSFEEVEMVCQALDIKLIDFIKQLEQTRNQEPPQ